MNLKSKTTPVLRLLSRELLFMQEILRGYVDDGLFAELLEVASSCSKAVEALLRKGWIRPWHALRLDSAGPEPPPGERVLRIGVFPTSANPFHWMHLIGGLMAIARFRLDKIVYIIAGEDARKPHLLPIPIRHQMGKEVLASFAPYFEYSPIAIDNCLPGEVNLFRLLQLNSAQRIHAFYLAGSDHYQRFHPQTGDPDTIQRLEDGIRHKIYDFCERRHRISVIFLDRGLPEPEVDTFLDIKWMRDLPLHCSSTGIRDALNGRSAPDKLLAVPYTVFKYIRLLELYCPCTANPVSLSGVPPNLIIEDSPAIRDKCSEFVDSLQRRFSAQAKLLNAGRPPEEQLKPCQFSSI
jgi:nicotinic acid mononucleotide adenylyltransferase